MIQKIKNCKAYTLIELIIVIFMLVTLVFLIGSAILQLANQPQVVYKIESRGPQENLEEMRRKL